jgi:glycosyltransferase involved in cell wall biosynthesis
LTRSLEIALVTPRYHKSVVGGAELHGRWLAEHLADRGHRVEVFSTCALDGETWANALPAGSEQLAPNLRVRRFPVDRADRIVRVELDRKLRTGAHVQLGDEELWLRNGVFSTRLERALQEDALRFQVVLAIPYLVGTTYSAFRAAPARFCLIPCLHDEVFARLAFTRRMLRDAWGLMLNTEPERELARRIEPNLARGEIIGLGWDAARPGTSRAFRQKYGVKEEFIVYVGRFESDKNVPELLDHFVRYKERHPGELRLLLVGEGSVRPPRRDDIRVIALDWDDRDAMLRSARVLVQPSIKESLSIVMMQAWLCELPVLVDARGEVPRDQCRRANGGLWYRSYIEFEAMLDRLLADRDLALRLGRQGRRYVETELSWERVLDRFEATVEAWSAVPAAS